MLVAAAAGSLAVSQQASEALVHQDLIYDVGMNNGDDTAYYLRRGFRVVAIEANTRLAKCAAERFRTQISSGQLRILNIGIAAEEGELPFWICETYSEWSSLDREIASRDGCPHHEVMVPCRRFSNENPARVCGIAKGGCRAGFREPNAERGFHWENTGRQINIPYVTSGTTSP